MDERIEIEIARITKESALILNTENDRDMFAFYLRRIYARNRTAEYLASVDGRDLATGFLEMME
jgi:hypothetical protein